MIPDSESQGVGVVLGLGDRVELLAVSLVAVGPDRKIGEKARELRL
jgi:hypothetical protein